MSIHFSGVIVPAVTPYKENGQIDFPGVEKVFRHFDQHDSIDALYITGATGEHSYMNLDERKQILDIVTNMNLAKPYIPNIATMQKKSTMELAEYAKKLGVNTLGVIIPNECNTFDDVYDFLSDMKKLDVDVFIYQTGGTKYPIPVNEMQRLMELGNIVGIKDSCAPKDMNRHIGYMTIAEGLLPVIIGVEMIFLPSLSMGAVGVIGGGCNVYPQLLKKVHECYRIGDIMTARHYQQLVNQYVEVIYAEGSGNESMKYFLNLQGVDIGWQSRKAGVMVSDRKKQMLKDLNKKLLEL